MKKIKLPLEMANGVMVRTLDELKENWDLEKVVEHFVTGKLTTWLNDRYYTDLAEKVENLPKDGDGRKLQQALCRVFEMSCEDVELDVDEIAERKRRQDLLRQYTSDDEILKNVDHVAFDQEDLADLLDESVEKIYLFKNRFIVPISIKNKHYVGLGDVEVTISNKEYINFKELGVVFENIKFDEKYQKLVDENKRKEEEERIKIQNSKKIGDIVKFGAWYSEPIEWQILEINDGKALLLSKYALERKAYHKTFANITWENSDLRKWLNGEFFQTAFDGDVAKSIVESYVPAHYNPEYRTDPGNGTYDKVFLLSVKEVLHYLKTDKERICKPLAFVKNEVRNNKGVCRFFWWLRSPGFHACEAANVDDFGSVNFGSVYYTGHNVVRPAIWVELGKL